MLEPQTLLGATWLVVGFLFGKSFGKQLDQKIQNKEWFKNQSGTVQWFAKTLMDFLHHFWIGLLLMLYAPQIASLHSLMDYQAVYWFGVGLFLDDLPDVPSRFRKYFDYLFPNLVNVES